MQWLNDTLDILLYDIDGGVEKKRTGIKVKSPKTTGQTATRRIGNNFERKHDTLVSNGLSQKKLLQEAI